MAIKKSITDVNGITYDSYTRIRKVVLETQYDGTTLAEIHLEIYASEALRSKDDDLARKQPLNKGLYQVTGDSYNIFCNAVGENNADFLKSESLLLAMFIQP